MTLSLDARRRPGSGGTFIRGIGTATPAPRYTKAACLVAFQNSAWYHTLNARARLIVCTLLERDNAVTRADAVLSVRAGFRGAELQALWPAATARWSLAETRAGLFSHCFVASRLAATSVPGS